MSNCFHLLIWPPLVVYVLQVGDETLSVMEIWGAEYQENDALLIKPEHRAVMQSICDRERCLMQVCLYAWVQAAAGGQGRLQFVHGPAY